ncbi:MAG: methyltransferase domain-containing protein [Alistipes sp.]|nr:methyltransferase domain-containing protein [Alistipes sp.]
MDNQQNTIHDFDLSLICDYFKNLERQGPGSPEATIKALGLIDKPGPEAQVADLGCGTGGQTMTLAENLPCSITAIDIFPPFIEILNTNAHKMGYGDRARGVVGSMDDLPFGPEELDLIWSEGAIYNIGFEDGLRLWNPYLKPGGYVAISESSWLTGSRPKEIDRFWEVYPGMETIPANIARMERAGYIPVAHFILGPECWRQHFYGGQDTAIEKLLTAHPGNERARELAEYERLGKAMYERHNRYYGYVFYIGRKADR